MSGVRSASWRVGSFEWTRSSTDNLFFSWGPWVLLALVAGFFPGPAAAEESEAPPAAPRVLLLHLDAELGDDAATGLSWDEPLRSLEEVQRRIDEGSHVAGLRLAAGWYPGALHVTRPLRIEGGYPPAGLPREGRTRVVGDPTLHRSVIDALGRSAVLRIEGASLALDGVVLTGGWSLEGGAIAGDAARLSLTRCELLDSGPALLGCRDCSRVEINDSLLARSMTAGVELFGQTRTELRVQRSEFADQRRAVLAEFPADVELDDCRLSGLEREALALPKGSRAELSRVEEIDRVKKIGRGEEAGRVDGLGRPEKVAPVGGLSDEPPARAPSPAPVHRPADR